MPGSLFAATVLTLNHWFHFSSSSLHLLTLVVIESQILPHIDCISERKKKNPDVVVRFHALFVSISSQFLLPVCPDHVRERMMRARDSSDVFFCNIHVFNPLSDIVPQSNFEISVPH